MFTWDHSGASRFRRVNVRSRRFARVRLWVAEFIRVGVHSGSLSRPRGWREFTWARPVVAGLISVRHLGWPRARRVHSGSRGFTRVRLGVAVDKLIHQGSLGLWVDGFFRFRVGVLMRAEGSSGSLGFAWVHSGAQRCRRVRSCSRRCTRACLRVA